jgi:hypothetical protein
MTRADTEGVSPHADRWEYVDAFVQYARATPNPERLTARPRVAVLVASLAAIGALLGGAVVGLFVSDKQRRVGVGTSRQASGATAPPGSARPGAYTAVTGADCRNIADRSFLTYGRDARWGTVTTGGWTSDNCGGAVITMPMSGDAANDDPVAAAVWSFSPGSAIDRCAVAVYSPKLNPAEVAAAPSARYELTADNGTHYGSFALDQTAMPGNWVEVGVFAVNNGKLAVRLGNRGVPTSPRQRLIASQLRVVCGAGAR